jgi:TP901 family phage tail tape measure protein
MSAVEAASILARVALRDEASTGLQNIKNQTQGLGGNLRQMGGQLQGFGAQMTAAFALPAVALGVAINQTRTFDRTMSNVNAILGLTGDSAASLRAEILAYGSNTVAGPQATAEAFYEIVSGVADASTHMAILEAATETAEAGQADLGATTSALISIMNSYGFTAEQAAFASDVLTRTVGMGVGSMDEFAAAFPQVTGLASQFGIGLDAVGASMAYLTVQGFSASESATMMKNMITTLLNPTTDLATAIQGLGYESGAALIEGEGLVGAYQLLGEQNGGLDGLITNTEALQGALALTGDGAADFFTTYQSGIDGATASAGVIQDQTEGWDRMNSALSGLAITAGTTLAPVLTDLIENQITPAINTVSDWISKNPQLTATILGIVGVLTLAGPIIAGVGTAMTIAGGAATALGIAVGIVSSPFVALGLIIAGLIWMFNRPGGFIGTLQEAYTNAVNLANQLNTIINLIPSVNINGFGFTNPFNGAGTATGDPAASGRVGAGVGAMPRALGGPVLAGNTYLVGERGPELFVPSSNGQIVPNNDLQSMRGDSGSGNGGGGGVTIQQLIIHANTEAGGRAAARGFDQELADLRGSRGI